MRPIIPILVLLFISSCNPRFAEGLRKKDLQRDVEMVTTRGTMIIRLSDSTPLHRNNFLKLVKRGYYDSILFHRVIKDFMIQAGDPGSKTAVAGQPVGNGDIGYTIPAEIRSSLFHHKGVIAAARKGDEENPQKASSATQFYLVQGRTFTDAGLDSVENFRLNGYKIPVTHRQVYKQTGGAPHLDNSYTVFGQVISGLEVIDSIANVSTSGRTGGDRPLTDIRILKAQLIRRKL